MLEFIDKHPMYLLLFFAVILLIFIFRKWFKDSKDIDEDNDPMHEEMENLPYWIFRHGKVFSGRFWTEKTAKEFAANHPKWLVGYWFKELNKSPYDIDYEKRSTIWKEFDKYDEAQNCPYSS